MHDMEMVRFYRANAHEHRLKADETTLQNVRMKHIEAARKWASLAEIADRSERRD